MKPHDFSEFFGKISQGTGSIDKSFSNSVKLVTFSAVTKRQRIKRLRKKLKEKSDVEETC